MKSEFTDSEVSNILAELKHARTQLKSVEAERDELKQLLAHKNETADTFMNQVKKLHKNLEGAQLADGTPFCFRCKAYHLKDQQCLMPR